nr:leucine-rich repeat extensin-like protein 5 [Penaeus vannamei]
MVPSSPPTRRQSPWLALPPPHLHDPSTAPHRAIRHDPYSTPTPSHDRQTPPTPPTIDASAFQTGIPHAHSSHGPPPLTPTAIHAPPTPQSPAHAPATPRPIDGYVRVPPSSMSPRWEPPAPMR